MTIRNEFFDRPANDGADNMNADSPTPIPVRVNVTSADRDPRAAAAEALRRAEEEERLSRDIVLEYEEKYYGNRETAARRKRADEMASAPTGSWTHKLNSVDWRAHTSTVAGLDSDERLWASMAHLSYLFTVGTAIFTNPWMALLVAFIPLVIYMALRNKSEFVAFHALQSFAAQIMATVGWIALLIVGTIIFGVAITISAVASIVLIGIPFVLLFILLYILFVLAMILVPFAMIVTAIIAAYNTYNGRDFRYPFLANWIDRQSVGQVVVL